MNDGGRKRSDLAIGVRTLIAAGYGITDSTTHPRHVEISCARITALGAEVSMLVAFTSEPALAEDEIDGLRRAAEKDSRSLLIVAEYASDDAVSWEDFFRALGGEVPTWRALAPEYCRALLAAAQNELPPGMEGEPWFLFELLAADGFEFTLGRRVRHLGGVRRGARVSDLLAQMPDGRLLVIDAKATAGAFDARLPELRALGEYVARQALRKQGHDAVYAAVVVSSRFKQEGESLLATAVEFRVEYNVPVVFIMASTLAHIVDRLARDSPLRASVRWAHLFRGGLLTSADFDAEVEAALAERVMEGT